MERMNRARQARRLVLCSVVAEEVMAGARDRNDRQDYESFFALSQRSGPVVTPIDSEWLSCGRMISRYQERYGKIRSRDHQNDILILLMALRLARQEETILITENDSDFTTWLGFVHDRARLRIEAMRR
ncbi:MAG: hypothetical protein M3Y74_00620 [Chloroflexota bacterium]|nr:hypothetical protein [Chloroflexota bacterium]